MFSAKRFKLVVLFMVILSVFTSLLITEVNASPDLWSIDTVDPGGYVGSDTSLALDSSGYPHISYYDIDNSALKYARAPDEYFWVPNLDTVPLDDNGDSYDDGVEVAMDVDTTYSGTLGVMVDAYLRNSTGYIVDEDSSS